MTVELHHTVVPARDPHAWAQFLAAILGLSVDPPVAHFTPVTPANQVSLDHAQLDDSEPHHSAFMVSEQEFDAALARIQHGGITHYGDPACQETGQIYQQVHQRPQGHKPVDLYRLIAAVRRIEPTAVVMDMISWGAAPAETRERRSPTRDAAPTSSVRR